MWIFPRWEIHCWRYVRYASRIPLPIPTNDLACLDGTLNLWKTNSNFVRPDLTVQGAHVKGTEIGSLVFSVDGNTVLTRGGDHTVKRRFYVGWYFSAVCSPFPSMGYSFNQATRRNTVRSSGTVSLHKCDIQSRQQVRCDWSRRNRERKLRRASLYEPGKFGSGESAGCRCNPCCCAVAPQNKPSAF